MSDTSDRQSAGVTPTDLGDLANVDEATTTVASIRGPLHKPTAGASDEWTSAARSAAIADAAQAAAAPTKAEFDAVVAKLNSALAALRTHGVIAP